MPPIDLIIIAVYLIALAYVFYRATYSGREDTVSVKLDQGALTAQLEEQDLQGKVEVRVTLKPKYKFEPITELAINIANTSKSPIHVDWDRSSLTNFTKRARRVIRLTPSMNFDLSQSQVFSVVSPGDVLSEKVVAEDMLKRSGDGTLVIASPIVDLAAAAKLPDNGKLDFTLRLVLCLVERGNEIDDDVPTRTLALRFVVTRNLWEKSLPWNRKR